MLAVFERYAAIIAATAAAVTAYIWLPAWHSELLLSEVNLERVLGPIFDLTTFSAASLFAIYVLALSRAEGFLGKIFKTKTFRMFNGYVAKSILLNIITSIVTVWFIVFGFGDMADPTHILAVSAWVGLTAASLASVGRVVAIFLIIVRAGVKPKPEKPLGQAS